MVAPHPAIRLSVVVLVRDAAEPLRLTLASARTLADELVVVDTGSTDASRVVAREFGARVWEFPWCDDFSAARNFAFAQASGRWCLWLDAGETLSEADATGLREFVVKRAEPREAYCLTVRLPAVDASASVEQVARLRLIPNDPRIQFAGRVWESVAGSLSEHEIGISGLPQIIRRGERELDRRLKKQRAQRNMALAQLEMEQAGESSRLWACLGDALQTLGEVDRATACFQKSLQLAERASPSMLEAYYGLLTSLGTSPHQADEQLKLCMQALEIFPVDTQLLCALGGYMQARNNLELASRCYLTAFKYGQVNPVVRHVGEIRELAAVCHSVTLQLLDRMDSAVEFLESALRDDPHSVRLRRRLMDVFIHRGDRDAALRHAGALPDTTPHKEALRSAVRGACFAVQRNPVAAQAYLSAAYSHGCRDAVCLKWLALCLLSAGKTAQAQPILEEWKQLEPRNPEIDKLLGVPAGQPAPGVPPTRRIDAPSAPLGGPAGPIKLDLPAWSPTAPSQ